MAGFDITGVTGAGGSWAIETNRGATKSDLPPVAGSSTLWDQPGQGRPDFPSRRSPEAKFDSLERFLRLQSPCLGAAWDEIDSMGRRMALASMLQIAPPPGAR
jgi:hypothetical protein